MSKGATIFEPHWNFGPSGGGTRQRNIPQSVRTRVQLRTHDAAKHRRRGVHSTQHLTTPGSPAAHALHEPRVSLGFPFCVRPPGYADGRWRSLALLSISHISKSTLCGQARTGSISRESTALTRRWNRRALGRQFCSADGRLLPLCSGWRRIPFCPHPRVQPLGSQEISRWVVTA